MNTQQRAEYLGDSVYVEFDGWMLTLTTNNGYPDDPRNTVHLEPAVYAALVEYVRRLGEQPHANVDETSDAVVKQCPECGNVGPA